MKKYERKLEEKNAISSLKEMAFPRTEIRAEIRHHFYTINEHIVKLLLYPNEKKIHNKWITHISTPILRVVDMKWKVNKKYLPQDEYYEEFFIKPFENDDDYEILYNLVRDTIYDNQDLYTEYSKNNFPKSFWIKKIKDFYKEISKNISENKLNNQKLFKIIKKHFL